MPDREGIIMYPDPPANSPSLQPTPDEESEVLADTQSTDEER